jgi:hypothetical protein
LRPLSGQSRGKRRRPRRAYACLRARDPGCHSLLSSKLGSLDRVHKFGFHYDFDRATLQAEFDRLWAEGVDATSIEARRLSRHRWWRDSKEFLPCNRI